MLRHSILTRLAIAAGFILAAIFTSFAMSKTNYAMNYAVAAFIDANIAVILFSFGNSSLIRDLARIVFVGVLIHFFGFILFICKFPPNFYIGAAYALLIIQWCRLCWVSNGDYHDHRHDFRIDMVWRSYLGSKQTSIKKGKRCQ